LVLHGREGILYKKEGLLGREGCLTLKIKLENVQVFPPLIWERESPYIEN